MLAPKIRGWKEAKGTTQSFSVSAPEGTVAGDYALLFATARSETGITIATPAGWTARGSISVGVTASKRIVYLFSKQLTEGLASVTFEASAKPTNIYGTLVVVEKETYTAAGIAFGSWEEQASLSPHMQSLLAIAGGSLVIGAANLSAPFKAGGWPAAGWTELTPATEPADSTYLAFYDTTETAATSATTFSQSPATADAIVSIAFPGVPVSVTLPVAQALTGVIAKAVTRLLTTGQATAATIGRAFASTVSATQAQTAKLSGALKQTGETTQGTQATINHAVNKTPFALTQAQLPSRAAGITPKPNTVTQGQSPTVKLAKVAPPFMIAVALVPYPVAQIFERFLKPLQGTSAVITAPSRTRTLIVPIDQIARRSASLPGRLFTAAQAQTTLVGRVFPVTLFTSQEARVATLDIVRNFLVFGVVKPVQRFFAKIT